MAGAKEIRTKIKCVQNTQEITKMKYALENFKAKVFTKI